MTAQTLQLTLNFDEVEGIEAKPIEFAQRPVRHKISDFGEKIGGAKKDLAQAYLQSIRTITNDDLATKPLSSILPRFNLFSLVKTHKLSKENALWIKISLEHIGDKPRRQYQLQDWVANTRRLIDRIESCLKHNPAPSPLQLFAAEMETHDTKGYLTFQLYEKLADRFNFPERDFSLKNIELIYSQKTQNYLLVRNRRIHSAYETFDEAVESVVQMQSEKKRKKISFAVYKNTKLDSANFFIGKKASQGGSIIHLLDGFNSAKEAFSYLNNNEEELIQIWEKLKYIPDLRSGQLRPRQGQDWRKGQNVSPLLFLTTFGFRGVEFGNWVNNTERQAALNQTYDALMDLSQVIHKSPKALSLNGELALAFGARGLGRAAGHYEPGRVVINLTKTKGDGTLAHEWFHAVDNYFARQAGNPRGYATNGEVLVRQEMNVAFDKLQNFLRTSEVRQRAQKLDSFRSAPYWSTYVELAARCFESYLLSRMEELNISNDYLVRYNDLQIWMESGNTQIGHYPYPINEEIKSINAYYDELFNTIQEKVNMETKNVLLFKEQQFYSNAENTVLKIQQSKATAEQWLAAIQKRGGIKRGEDQWLGLTDWLQAQGNKPVTKGEILDFITSNKIVLHETILKQKPESIDIDWLYLGQEYEWMGTYDNHAYFIDNNHVVYDENYQKVSNQPKFESLEEAQNYTTLLVSHHIDGTRNAQWTSNGITHPQVLVLSSPSAQPWTQKMDDWQHYADIDNGRVIAWIRFGEMETSKDNSVLLVDEIQSNRHQKGRKVGYRTPEINAQLTSLIRQYDNTAQPEQKAEIYQKVGELLSLPPIAPFERNWHELAVKRMLAYASSAGYDTLAWTTGKQQAERYGLVPQIKAIEFNPCGKNQLFPTIAKITHLDDSISLKYIAAWDQLSEFQLNPKVVDKMMQGQAHFNVTELYPEHHGLSIFYDHILVQYMNEYTKKWGGQVQDIRLDKEVCLHGIQITPQMKLALHEPQPLFKIVENNQRQNMGEVSHELMNLADTFHTSITIARTKQELPEHIYRAFQQQQRYHAGELMLPGVYDTQTGQVYFVLEDISSPQEARQVFFHEVVAHKGIEGILGKEKAETFYAKVFDSLDIYTQQHLFQKYGDKQIAAAEYVALIAEENKNQSLLDRIVSILKEILMSIGVTMQLNNNDIVRVLAASKQHLQQQSHPKNSQIHQQKNQNKLS